jgi:KDO2-lipid IV(A) lauroyltransferase
MMSHPGLMLMRLLAFLPLAWVRALGVLLGLGLYVMAQPRRKVVQVNLALCFPQLTWAQRQRRAVLTFVHFAQAWLDRGWLWHGRPELVRQRLRLSGAVHALQGTTPTVIFAPHFYGLDAGWTALTQQLPRAYSTIYTPQPASVDAWIKQGRQRYGHVRLFGRADGVKSIVAALRAGEVLYLLPDMNFGPQESIFVPFYGVSAATVPSLSRFAKLGRAQVVPVITRMTAQGYVVEVHEPWADFPSDDVQADTALMNQRLQAMIDTMPEQYYWVHKRFKTRPAGQPGLYQRAK